MNLELSLKMIDYFGVDAKRIHHAMQVYGFAETIILGENIGTEKRDIIETAALIHDIGIPEAERKYGSSAGNYQETEGPPIAREILLNLGFAPSLIERVCFIIGNHHSYTKIDDIDFQILVEADLIVNIYGNGIERAAAQTLKDKHFVTATGSTIVTTMYDLSS